ncbi:hypothetical protein V8U11_09255 [Pseudomonas chlororaphis]|uniref:hypothetical protein n=1 Tax=Pseudomonas chlororaphis TaxID=587753 RepID=UPI0030D3DD2E
MINSEQFDALAELIRLRVGASQDAARLVLVEGLAPGEAARRVGTTPQAVSNVLTSCRKGIKLAQKVCGTSAG